MNSIKERPIILTEQEVNAVLAGDKTQYRVIFDFAIMQDHNCPFGKVGDRLWVQEKHQPVSWSFDDGEVTLLYLDGSKRCLNYLTEEEFDTNPNDDYLIEICDELIARGVPIKEDSETFDISSRKDLPHWRSADAMPRWASRLLLEVTDIRIERDQPLSVAQIVFSNPWVWVVEFKVIDPSEVTK